MKTKHLIWNSVDFGLMWKVRVRVEIQGSVGRAPW